MSKIFGIRDRNRSRKKQRLSCWLARGRGRRSIAGSSDAGSHRGTGPAAHQRTPRLGAAGRKQHHLARFFDKIADAFVRVLTGIFHKRVEYPDIKGT